MAAGDFLGDVRAGGAYVQSEITGNLFEEVTDYTTVGANPLAFTRYYNSVSWTRGLTP